MNWRIVILALVLACGGCAVAHGQEIRLRWHGNAEGLANLSVHAFHMDRQGFVWAITDNGV